MEWLKKNRKYFIILLAILFVFKFIQSCNRGMTNTIQTKNFTEERDSIIKVKDDIIWNKDFIIDSLKSEIITREFIIKDLNNDLKIAGVRENEAQKRADAILRTAEKIKNNTTIEIKNQERDSTEIN